MFESTNSKKSKTTVRIMCSICSQRNKSNSKTQPFRLEYLSLKATMGNLQKMEKEDIDTFQCISKSCSQCFDRYSIYCNGRKEDCNKVIGEIFSGTYENKNVKLGLYCKCKWPMCYDCEWWRIRGPKMPFAHYANCDD